MRRILFKTLQYIFLVLIAAIFLIPLLYVLYNSLLPYRYIQTLAPVSVMTMDNFRELFEKYPIMTWYWNTFISTVLVVCGNLFFTTMTGYALAKLRFPGRKILFNAFMLSMMVPFQLVIIQMYIQLAELNMQNSLASIVVPFLSQTIFIFMSRQYFYSVPDELIEAARIDGLSHAGVFFRMVIPNSKTLFATIAIINFTGTWNSYMVPSTFINRTELYTLSVGLQTVNQMYFQRTDLTLAGVVLLSFPVILFFIAMQKYFVQGVMASGIKG